MNTNLDVLPTLVDVIIIVFQFLYKNINVLSSYIIIMWQCENKTSAFLRITKRVIYLKFFGKPDYKSLARVVPDTFEPEI